MLSLVRRLSGWPLWLLHALGGGLGWLAWALSPTYRQHLAENARQAGIGAAERRAAVGEAGRLVMELPRLWLRPHRQPIADPVHWDDAALVDELVARGRGLVLVTPHLGSFEMAAQAYAERYGRDKPLTALFRPARQPWLRRLQETSRARPALATAPASLAGVRQMLRALKRGETVGLLPDQVPPEGMGVWVPFFGRPAYTMTLAARLAQQTGADIALLWAERLPRGRGYAMHAQAFAEPLPAQDDEAAACAVNRALEQAIRRCPRQYLWGYHRYKPPRRLEGPR